jgi:putative acetyltransferase
VPDVRPETGADQKAIWNVLERAFAPSIGEAKLVDELRAAGDLVPELCLVAEDGGQVVGYIAYSRCGLDSGHEALALAPMAVLPERQRDGIGSALVRESLNRAAATNFPLVVVLGHPEYYPRFGFEPGAAHGVLDPYGVPPEAWMVHLLPAYEPEARGTVKYAEAFALVE